MSRELENEAEVRGNNRNDYSWPSEEWLRENTVRDGEVGISGYQEEMDEYVRLHPNSIEWGQYPNRQEQSEGEFEEIDASELGMDSRRTIRGMRIGDRPIELTQDWSLTNTCSTNPTYESQKIELQKKWSRLKESSKWIRITLEMRKQLDLSDQIEILPIELMPLFQKYCQLKKNLVEFEREFKKALDQYKIPKLLKPARVIESSWIDDETPQLSGKNTQTKE